MNQYELAVLRILLKSPGPISKSKVVDGFPDDSSDYVLSAISDLKLANLITSRRGVSGNDEALELVKERKKDILTLFRLHEVDATTSATTAPSEDSRGSSSAGPSGRKGARMMWITTALMILGALTSVYVAYAIGVNDRVLATTQLSYKDAAMFRVAELSDGDYSVGLMAKPVPTWYAKSGVVRILELPKDFTSVESSITYAIPPTGVKQLVPTEDADTGQFSIVKLQ